MTKLAMICRGHYKNAAMGGLGTAAIIGGGVALALTPVLAYLLANKQVRKQLGKEYRDPRLYSNLRGMFTGKSREDRVRAHQDLPGVQKNMLDAMRIGLRGHE